MTSIGKPLTQHLLDHLNAFTWLMDTNPAKPRAPTEVEIAHIRRAELACFDDHTSRDINMSASDATGISNYQEALPFFMQAGFR